ncbi:uncharacterized protein N7511_000294 [Penicillium nucicola]|uniref:uncharacterized protein n=1 Tax=Penicillium nucicola TaxID=1850975 RepID=UPI0025450757|nr:uncharacterized protein N7511_000294 [Penicillium nucicola]KAJ5775283.1 hypothetical protein N7511_000294 [Penicillium nucicola]
MKTNFDALPRELVFQIVDHCDTKSTANLSVSCKDMQATLEETAKRKASLFRKALPSDEIYKEYGFIDPKGYWMRDNGEVNGENRDTFEEFEHVTPEDNELFAQAVRSGNMHEAHKYLHLGVDPNSHCLGGARMLSLAVHSRSSDMVHLLANYGADLNAIDYATSMSALAHAIYTQQPDLIRALIELGADVNKHGLAAYIAHTCTAEIMAVFLEAEPRLDLTHLGQLVWTDHPAWEEDNGWAIMHHVAVRGDLDMFGVLLPHVSAEMINARSVYEETPLHLVVERGHHALALAFMSHGADVNARDLDGYSPLDRALVGGHWDIARSIIERWDVKLGIEDANGFTELHTAVRAGNVDIIRLLLRRGQKVRRGNCSETPLSIAIEMKRLDIVKIICEESVNDHPFINDDDQGDEQFASYELALELGLHEMKDYLTSVPKVR